MFITVYVDSHLHQQQLSSHKPSPPRPPCGRLVGKNSKLSRQVLAGENRHGRLISEGAVPSDRRPVPLRCWDWRWTVCPSCPESFLIPQGGSVRVNSQGVAREQGPG